ncbi:TIGR03862 family flavoprotein [Methylobrevis albus]|uniref:TIGR03862 family flavoprotein n=1 Tax=Methylobrevis albus TaxID=2793297 RepID=A0A931I4U4_9HYPH|nr:TIGR03862 family flavoprotein [Methylobrevis albus]MBH0239281.1 TIGR03862 family flavoprotein [Methylobrevis albus]
MDGENADGPGAARSPARVAVIGGGPAGLAAAERLAEAGVAVTVYDAMPSFGRKFLLAGKSGLNLTHTEPYERFAARYGAASPRLAAALAAFPPAAVAAWAEDLGGPVFTGSSGRVFPVAMKASPLLRAWLRRLEALGVAFAPRHRWTGWTDDGADAGALAFDTPAGAVAVEPDAVVLALGGASWPRLGSDGGWTDLLARRGVAVAPLVASNCGFEIAWSQHLADRFAGAPVKSVRLTAGGRSVTAEFVVTRYGIEGGGVYALGPELRAAAAAGEPLRVDLAPGRSAERLAAELSRPRAGQSMANHLRKRAGIAGVKAALLREAAGDALADPQHLAAAIKALPLRITGPRPIAEAISSAGGVAFDGIDESFGLRALPGVFVAGEMLDWDAPTGGYLLTACFATGRAAADGVLARLAAPGL